MKIPRLDYSQLHNSEFEGELIDGFSNVGFVTIENHPITSDLQQEFHRACKEVFSLSEQEKSEYEIPGFKGQRGFVGFGREQAVGAKAPDLKEFWHVGRDPDADNMLTKDYLPNVFPTQVPEFEKLGMQLFSELETVSQQLLICLTDVLGVKGDYFYDFVASGNSILRALHYPGFFRSEYEESSAVRAASHTDINLITLLLGASQRGLQVQAHNGEWVNVHCKANEVIVNVGDMLQRLSNMRFVSTVHRVLNPVAASGVEVKDDFVGPRISIPFFCHPASDMPLDVLDSCTNSQNPPKFEDITAGNYLYQRLAELGLLEL